MTLRNYFRLLAEDHPSVDRSAWFWRPVLKLASGFYHLGLNVHRALYRTSILKRKTFACPVVSIGNITWGGTGKTPLVEYVARFFLNRRRRPLILSRGYSEDEIRLLSRQLPEARFGTGKDRFRAGQLAMKKTPADVIILDDGFQHWRIKRDLDIVAVNVLNPLGNFSLIPRGILREPVKSLKRARLVVLTDVNFTSRKNVEDLKVKIRGMTHQVEFIEAYREALYFYRPTSRERISVDRLQGERVTSFSGIGMPRSFQMLLNHLGLKTIRNFEFSDHHCYSEGELKEILQAKEASESEEIVTTEKDFFRCEQAMRKWIKPLVLKVRLRLTTGESTLHQYLNRFVQPGAIEPSPAKEITPQNENLTSGVESLGKGVLSSEKPHD